MLSRNTDISSRSEGFYEAPTTFGPTISLSDIFATLRRDWVFPLIGCLIGLALGVFYVSTAPSVYKSTARILVDRSANRYLQTNKIVAEPFFDQTELESQVHILSSESIIIPVVRSMNLASDREFVGPPSGGGAYFMWKVANLVKAVKQSVGWSSNATAETAIDREVVLERTAVDAFLKNLSAYREDVANVITLTFSSSDPNKAARIANAIADTYVTSSQETKTKSIRIASQLLHDRLTELKAQTIEADTALQNYKVANNLVNSGEKGLLIFDRLLTELLSVSSELTKARVTLAETQARLDRIRSTSGDRVETTGASASNDSVIVKLRTQYMDLTAKAADIEARVAPGHEAVVKIRKQMDELRASIRAEDERVNAAEYDNVKARETELAATMERLVVEARKRSQAQVSMRDLESSADVSRSLYSSLLQKFQEISATQTQEIGVQDVRIVTRAAPPLRKASNKGLLVLGGSLVVGLFLGAGAAVAKEWMADVFRTSEAVTQTTGIHSAVLPLAARSLKPTDRVRADAKPTAKPTPIEEFALDHPYSRFTETLRSVKAMIAASQDAEGNAKVIGIVSSVAKEGKTTVAANLGALMIAASRADTRVLIIDGDLHLRNLTARLAPDAREGLIEALANPSRLPTLVCKRPRSRLDVLPCVLSSRLPNAAELLGSPQMEHLLAAARRSYDFVIIEVPPIMSVVDLKVVERLIDRFIFVIEWGQTKRRLVLEALGEAEFIHDRLVGIVLNKADPSALRSIEAYKGVRFKDYYEA